VQNMVIPKAAKKKPSPVQSYSKSATSFTYIVWMKASIVLKANTNINT